MKITKENTDISTWFERDRAYAILSFNSGCEDTIFELWDSDVYQFIEDGFKKDSESWHDALLNYANEHKMTKKNSGAGSKGEF